MSGINDVWVLIEADGNFLGAFAEGLMREGRRLADQLGGNLSAVLLGPTIAGLADSLGCHGVDHLYCQDKDKFAEYQPEVVAAILTALLRENNPRLLLALHSSCSADFMPRIAALRGAPLITKCTNIDAAAGEIEFARQVQGGKLQEVRTAPHGGPSLATIDPDYLPNFEISNFPQNTVQHDINTDLPDYLPKLRVKRFIKADPKTVDLEEAEIVLAVGNGMGGKENFPLFEQFAELIGASLGGSRPVIDSGVLPHERQIGQTGKKLTARLVLMCGISGSEYFTVGLEQAGTKVAINSDRDAPVMKEADLCIVADANPLLAKFMAHVDPSASSDSP